VVSSKIVLIGLPLKSWFYLSALTVADAHPHCQTTPIERILTRILAPNIPARRRSKIRIMSDGLRISLSPVKLRWL
ncbi:MAG TPA: hypothetical protein VKE91_15595, partial [Blastocatellia bacterium]|nr:hypothetical protein [Blastocatellia bacterium]